MTLINKAYLEFTGGSNDPATFQFDDQLEHSSEVVPSHIMAERGQYIREVVNQTPATGEFDADRRTGFWIDGGAGEWTISLSFRRGRDDDAVVWGDGSGGTGASNVTKTDASGAGVPAISMKQVLQYWIAKSKADSTGAVRLHHGEWTDGAIDQVTGVSAGAYGEPQPVAFSGGSNFDGPDPNNHEGGTFTGQLDMSVVALWGGAEAPAWATDAVGAVINAADFIPDE